MFPPSRPWGEMQRHSEEGPCEDTGERQPSLSQGETSQDPAGTIVLGLGLRAVGKWHFHYLNHSVCGTL